MIAAIEAMPPLFPASDPSAAAARSDRTSTVTWIGKSISWARKRLPGPAS